MKVFSTLLFCLPVLSVLAQELPAELITDRADQTESSAVVPFQALQLETGFAMETTDIHWFRIQTFAYNTSLLRYGLRENFELRAGLEYLGKKQLNTATGVTFTSSGLGPLYAGFKVKISEEKGWKPGIAFLGGLVLPFTAGEDFETEHTGADIRFAFSHSLTDRLSLGYNLGAQWDGETAVPSYFYSVSMGVRILNQVGMFVESFGHISEEGEAEHLLDAGFTWQVLSYFQLDFSGGVGIHNSIDEFFSVGLTYRLPY
ncbi:MAG: transporter [Bacteroidales bacterium]|nr:transporter [Bacteroidales bacterium]